MRGPSVGAAWLLATALAYPVSLGEAASGAPNSAEQSDRVWIGPRPFVSGRALRDDFIPVMTDETAWPTVLSQAEVLKSYIMLLPDVPLPGKDAPELSDKQLRRLVEFVRAHGLKTAFEVGGLRNSASICGDDAGEKYAEVELTHLRRWIRAGGRIDYLTTDHAVMMNMRGVGFPGPGLDPERPCKMTVAELTEELADYFQIVHRELPETRFGVIESLGFFQVQGPDGRDYPQTDPKLPAWSFTGYFDGLLAAMARRGLTLDHFHIDFGYGGVRFDGRRTGKLDYGRILGVESYVRSKGVKAGVIFNAFHDRRDAFIDRETANRQAYERTLEFVRGYLAAGGRAEHLVIQTWHPYPDRTGPEDEAYTVLNIAREIVSGELFPE